MFSFILNNRDNILAFISIAAFLMSLGQLIHTAWNNRFHLTLYIYNHEYVYTRNLYSLSTCINNISSAPIAITRVFLCDSNGNEHPCSLGQVWLGEEYYPKFPESDIPRTHRILSPNFPINLMPHESALYHLVFKVEQGVDIFPEPSFVKLRIQTTKGSKTYRIYCPKVSKSFLSV